MSHYPLAHLVVTDGNTRVSLIGRETFFLDSWRPAISQYKGGGTFSDSPFAHGRRLVNRRFDNAVETFNLRARSRISPDDLIHNTQELLTLLEQAASYWETNWQGRPVWLEARSAKETNTRYAIIYTGGMAELGNPYAQPFLSRICAAAWDSLALVIERGHWQSSPPATKPCIPLPIIPWAAAGSEQQTYLDVIKKTAPYAVFKLDEAGGAKVINYITKPLPYDGYGTYVGTIGYENLTFLTGEKTALLSTSGVDYADLSFTSMEDYFLPNQGSFSFWFNTTGPMWTGTGSDFYWFNIQVDAAHYLRMYKEDNGGAAPYITRLVYGSYDTVPGIDPGPIFIRHSWGSTTDGISNKWINVTVTWFDNLGTQPDTDKAQRWVKLYINGQLVGIAHMGTLEEWPAFDDATSLFDLGTGPTGGISSTVAYATIWRRAITSEEVSDLTEILSNSYDTLEITDDNFDYCEDETITSRLVPGQPPLLSKVFTSNFSTNRGLDSGWIFDTSLGTYTDLFNLTVPYDLLPSNAGVGDIIYLGIDSNVTPNALFSNVIFDIDGGTNSPGGFTLVWEYYNGATWVSTWTNEENDETNGLLNTGVRGLFFFVEDDWTATAINGVTAYWVRGRVTATSGNYNPPTQINRDVYTAHWPYIRIPETSFEGEIPASVGLEVVNRAYNGNDDPGLGSLHLYTSALIGGARTVSRGSLFNAYLNWGNQHNPPQVNVYPVGALTAFGTGTGFPAVSVLRWSPTTETGYLLAYMDIPPGIARHYHGIFRVFMRVIEDAEDSGETASYQLRFLRSLPSASYDIPAIFETEYQSVTSGSMAAIDMGMVDLTGGLATPDEYNNRIVIALKARYAGGTPPASWDVEFCDLIMIPADEWWFETGDIIGSTETYLGQDGVTQEQRALEINGFTHPKSQTNFSLQHMGLSHISRWRGITPARPYMLPGVEQKMWFLAFNAPASAWGTYALGGGYEWTRSYPGMTHSHRLTGVNNYLSARGAK